MYATTITKSNQITITKPAREALGIKAGEKVLVDIKDDMLVLHRPLTDEEFFKKLDSFKSKKTKAIIRSKNYENMTVSEMRTKFDNSPTGKKRLNEEFSL